LHSISRIAACSWLAPQVVCPPPHPPALDMQALMWTVGTLRVLLCAQPCKEALLALATDLAACLPLVLSVLDQSGSTDTVADVQIVSLLEGVAAVLHITILLLGGACYFVVPTSPFCYGVACASLCPWRQLLPREVAAALPSASLDGLSLSLLDYGARATTISKAASVGKVGSKVATDAVALRSACLNVTVVNSVVRWSQAMPPTPLATHTPIWSRFTVHLVL
jgi:hypothetical protein